MKLLSGLTQLDRRGDRRHWHCSASIDGRQYRATTGEDDLVLTKLAWFLALRGKSKAGLLTKEKTFRKANPSVAYDTLILTRI